MSKPNILQVCLPPDCKAYVEELAGFRNQSESGVGRDFLVPLIRAEMEKRPLEALRSQRAKPVKKSPAKA